MKNTDLSKRNLRKLILFLSFIVFVGLVLAFVYGIAPFIDVRATAVFKLLESLIPNLIAALIVIIVRQFHVISRPIFTIL